MGFKGLRIDLVADEKEVKGENRQRNEEKDELLVKIGGVWN